MVVVVVVDCNQTKKKKRKKERVSYSCRRRLQKLGTAAVLGRRLEEGKQFMLQVNFDTFFIYPLPNHTHG
jgi:hypothetical protein